MFLLLLLESQQVFSAHKIRNIKVDVPLSLQLKDSFTIYVIKYDCLLDDNIVIPSNCILRFEGGSLSGKYTLTGHNTSIDAAIVKIFDERVKLAGTWNVNEAYPEWFGAKSDGMTDCSPAFNALINLCYSKGNCDVSCVPIKVGKGVYILESPIIVPFDQNQYLYGKQQDRERYKDWNSSLTILGSGYMSTTLKAGKNNKNSLLASANNREQYCSKPRLKNLVIKDITFSGSLVCPTCFSNWSTLQIYKNNFENVTFTEFTDVAVDVMRMGDETKSSAQNSECNWRNVNFLYNKVGLKVNGASSSFYGCRWERNYYRGLVISGYATALSFYESLIQYNVDIDPEYERDFKNHCVIRGTYPGNLVFENVKDAQVNFHGSYFEPSYDKVVEVNYPPIHILQDCKTMGGCEINIEDSYYNMFTDFIKITRTDYNAKTGEHGQCYAANINLKNLKITRTNPQAYVLAYNGGYLTLHNSYFSVHNSKMKMGSVVLDNSKSYDKLDGVYIDIPLYGTSNNRPNYLIGLGQTYFDTDLKKLLVKVEQRNNPNAQEWADYNGNYIRH